MKLSKGFGTVNYSCVSSIQLYPPALALWHNTSVLTGGPIRGQEAGNGPMAGTARTSGRRPCDSRHNIIGGNPLPPRGNEMA